MLTCLLRAFLAVVTVTRVLPDSVSVGRGEQAREECDSREGWPAWTCSRKRRKYSHQGQAEGGVTA